MKTQNLFVAAILGLVLAVMTVPARAQGFRALHQFNGETPGDGAVPHGALLLDEAGGNLYGTTLDGGTGDGTVFKIDSTGKETVLFAFDAPVSGSSPDSPLIQDQAGNLYGVVQTGGPGGVGVVYKLSPQGEQTILHAFQNQAEAPAVPTGGLFMDNRGNLFGTTFSGGRGSGPNCPLGCGTIYRIDLAGNFRVLHEFAGAIEGSEPFGPLVADAGGNLYGVARVGGNLSCPDPDLPGDGCGTVFRLSRNGKLTVLHIFQGGMDGSIPQSGLTLDAAGNLYGVTNVGGRREHGTVFKISPDGSYSVLHRFQPAEGTNPNGGLVVDAAGNIYGTTQANGTNHLGTAFQLSPSGELTVLHFFHGHNDGAQPFAGLVRDSFGHFFGTTITNLLNQPVQGGNVFEIIP
jgi:uncharacterized repeat protein (TIGR03803 family)